MVTKPENYILAVRRRLLAIFLAHRRRLLAIFLAHRRRVQRGTLKNHYRQFGLCFLLYRHQDAEKQLFVALFRKWSKFSGSVVYPVPSANDNLSCPGAAYDYAQCTLGDMYSGEYGALRLELLDFCINELKSITRWSPEKCQN